MRAPKGSPVANTSPTMSFCLRSARCLYTSMYLPSIQSISLTGLTVLLRYAADWHAQQATSAPQPLAFTCAKPKTLHTALTQLPAMCSVVHEYMTHIVIVFKAVVVIKPASRTFRIQRPLLDRRVSIEQPSP